MTKTTDIPAKEQQGFHTVNLKHPIPYGSKKLDQFDIRKPTAGDLRGIKLSDLMQMESEQMMKLIPRIATPALTEAQLSVLEIDDVVEVFSQISGFFMKD